MPRRGPWKVHFMRFEQRRRWFCALLATSFALAAAPSLAQGTKGDTVVDQYVHARRAYEEETAAYWRAVSEKRRIRNAKRRDKEPILLSDYVLEQPPVYSGPPRPPGPAVPPEPRKPEMPVVADFLAAAAEEFGFVPRRPKNEIEFKRAYARAALEGGLTKEQALGVYAFETGGNGAYDTQAGVTGPGSRAISPALGYNQLLSTNSVGLLAEHGDRLIEMLAREAETLSGAPKQAMQQKLGALRRMVAFSRTVPNQWSEHDRLAKTTRGGKGIHAAVLDLDIGPWLQTRKLVNSVLYAKGRGHGRALTAAELELMNFTGDGNGFDMVTMPAEMRRRVPTSNFFLQEGYERNPIARRTGVVAALIESIESRMVRPGQTGGMRDLAGAFDEVTSSVPQR
jgi:hypothetical protein